MSHPKRLIILLSTILFLAACGGEPSPIGQVTAPAAATATPTVESTATPPPTQTPAPTQTPTATSTAVPPTFTPKLTDTPVLPTQSPTPKPSPTSTATNTPAPPTATHTPAPATPTPTPPVSTAQLHFEQGIAYYKQEKWAEAVAEFQETLRLDPQLAEAYGWLGYSYAFNQDYQKAVLALEKYLQLLPAAEDQAQVETDLQVLRERLAETPPGLEIPPGKALFVFTNYTHVDWSLDVGPHHLDIPAWQGGEYPLRSLVMDPGTYTWQAHSPGGGYYITDATGNRAFEFTLAAGEIYPASVR